MGLSVLSWLVVRVFVSCMLLEVNPDSALLLAYWPTAASACAVDVCLLLTAYCLVLSVCSNTVCCMCVYGAWFIR